jgi:uncharacterized protein (TIGR02611 family)
MTRSKAHDRSTAEAPSTGHRRSLRQRVRSTPTGRLVWRVGATIVGVAVIVGGIVLLPLPGPGWLIIFGGLGILATEYEWARRLLKWMRAYVRRWTDWAARQPLWARLLLGLFALVFLAAIALGGWYLSR